MVAMISGGVRMRSSGEMWVSTASFAISQVVDPGP